MTKQVASISVIGAIVNIIINVLLIKYIGLYAASISTAISYFVMMINRHYDLKKYVKIKYEDSLLIKTILIYLFAIIIYYQRNLVLDIISLIIVVIYCYLLNRKFLWSTLINVKQKLVK